MQAGHRPTPGRHQVCTCTFAGNIRLPQPAPGRHRTGSPGGPRPVTAGFLRKSGVCPGFLRKLGRAPTPTRARRRCDNMCQNFDTSHPHPHARGGEVQLVRILTTWRAPTPARARRHLAFTEFCESKTKHPHLHARGILCQNSDTIIEKIALTLTRAVYCCLSEI